MTTSRDEVMEAWGYYLAAIDRIVTEHGMEIKDAMLDDFLRRPKIAFVKLHRLVKMRDFTDEENEEIGLILTAIESGDDRGTNSNPCSIDDQGKILLAYHHYDKNRMTVKEAADELGVSTQAVYKMLKSGALRGVGARGSRMVFASSVESKKSMSENHQS